MNGLQVAAGLALLCLIAWLCFIGRTQVVAGGPITERAFRSPQWASIFALRNALPDGWRITDLGPHATVTCGRQHPPTVIYRIDVTADDGPTLIRVRDEADRTVLLESVDNVCPPIVVATMVHHANNRPLPVDENQHHDEIS